MNFSPSLPEFLKGTDAYDLIGIQAEFSADTETPLSAYAKLADQKPAFLFESVVGGEQVSRYSFIGFGPRKVISSQLDWTEITEDVFKGLFKNSAVKRTKFAGLKRNINFLKD